MRVWGWWFLTACAVTPPDDVVVDSDTPATVDSAEPADDTPAPLRLCDADGDGAPTWGEGCLPAEVYDCDDGDAEVFPGAVEVCDGRDEDCSGAADDPFDADGDGQAGCAGDCDDADPYNAEILPEWCDGRDNDCDGDVDEGFDADGDGIATCRGDCDDGDPETYLGAVELCDGLDNDCDPLTLDEGDVDGDGVTRCGGDCDDLDAAVAPGFAEVCDRQDNDCDGQIEADPACFGCVLVRGLVLCTTPVPYGVARDACAAGGRQLVSIANAAENDRVASVASPYGYAWIGLTDEAQEGVWAWEDGAAVVYANWSAGEPNDAGGNEDCTGTNFPSYGLWNDFSCSTELPFVCEL
jgi:hypothetical protein